MSEWRYNRNGRPSDPIDATTLGELLKTGSLPPDTLVWREGMPDWAKANTLPEFAPVTTPPAAATTAIVSVPSDAKMPPPSTPPPSSSEPTPSSPPSAPEPAPKIFTPPPPTSLPSAASSIASEQADIDQNRVFAVLAYIWLLFLVPLLAAPKSRFARYHTNQGVVLFLASTATYIGLTLLSFILAVIPFLGCLLVPLLFVVPMASLVFMILGIVNAASGQFKPLPLIGHFELMKTDPVP